MLEKQLKLMVGRKITYPKYENYTPLEKELKEFVTAIAHKYPPRTDINQGLLTVRVLSAAELSLRRNGREVKLES